MEFSKVKDNNADSWHWVQDPRKRKQIQDRLAQRARRVPLVQPLLTTWLTILPGKRLAEAGKNPKQSLGVQRDPDVEPQSDAIPGEKVDTGPSDTTMGIVKAPFPISASSFSSISGANNPVNAPFPVSSPFPSLNSGTNNSGHLVLSSAVSLNPQLPCDHRFLPDPKMSAIMALWVNGSMMGISCNGTNFVKSSPQPSSVPQVLHPTPLQLSTPHYDWIDRWPFPRMRDNLIVLSLSNVGDVDELFKDFFLMRSFSVKEGAHAWDPQAWQICPEFEAKWGYLLY
jgi:hypothetical protein